ncbi:MAG: hypothetical protein KAT35_01600, partial [Candidatus Aenigmarchaeota archaeon]|nr:hypothetical protein [Candidatus Aenigmarchaeota archaeon]
ITGRTRTTAYVDDEQLSVGYDAWYQTPSLVTPFQEVIDNYSPTAVVLIFSPSTDVNYNLKSQSYDGSSSNGAKLHIEWTAEAEAAGHSYGTIIG